MEFELETPDPVETVETVQPVRTTFQDRSASWTPSERDHWKLTGEEPETKSDATAASSTATPETSSPEGTVKTETESGPGKNEKEQKGARQSWSELREAKARAEAKAELLEKQLAESRKSPPAASTEERKAEPLTQKPVRPKIHDPKFKSIEEYEAAFDAYEVEKEKWDSQQFESRLQGERQHLTAQQTERTRAEQIAEMKKVHPDYEAVAFSKDVPASDVVLSVLDSLPNGAAIRYALGKNIAEATRITELTHIEGLSELWKTNPARAGYLWGVAEATAKAELAKLIKPKTAPLPKKDPPKPSGEVAVSGKGGGVDTMDDDALLSQKKISFSEWKRRKNQSDVETYRAGVH